MKNLKKITAVFAILAFGALAFADSAAANYLSKFTTLVTSAEACAKNKDGSKAASIAAQKVEIDALRKTVTLTTTQRFSDWRLTGRYNSAYAKIKAAAASSSVVKNGSEKASQTGKALGDAANSIGGALKETGSNAVNSVKDSVNTAANNVKDTAKSKVDEKVNETTNTVTGKIQEGAQGLTNALNNFLSGNKEE